MESEGDRVRTRRDTLRNLADFFIEMMEGGDLPPWARSWRNAPVPRSVYGRQYTGVNRLYLEGLTAKMRYRSPYWATRSWVEKLGGAVPEGAPWGEVEGVFNVRDRATREDTNSLAVKVTPVINIQEVFKEVPPRYPDPPVDSRFDKARLISDSYLRRPENAGPSLTYNPAGRNPLYRPGADEIEMPDHGRFYTTDGFYHELFHEMAHSTGHRSRLNRSGVADFDHFGSYQYGMEELVAEMTAAMMCRESDIDSVQENMDAAAYLKSWLRSIWESPNMLYNAIDDAARATNHLLRMKAGGYNSDGKPKTVGQALAEIREQEEKERKEERRQSQ